MESVSRLKQLLLVVPLLVAAIVLTACGGSSSNVSPGTIVVPPDGGEPTDPNVPTQPPEPPPGGDVVQSFIPAPLSDAIFDSGETAAGGKPVYVIDVAALPGGVLDPDGLLLGNDFVFRIEGGALRIAQN